MSQGVLMSFNNANIKLDDFMNGLVKRNPGEKEFHQAVMEVAESIIPFINDNKIYIENRVLERLTEPDRAISFRVVWEDDAHNVRINRGYRVQFSNAIGPYKGGLRFHPSVNLSILKFLGFEQIFKNALTTLPMGAAKGGSDFNPKGKSDREVMRFCKAFMLSLYKYIGKDIDVPAGDIGVGAREISYMFGQYKRITGEFNGVLTGKGLNFGGSLIRTEATGYGCVYFAREMLKTINEDFDGKAVAISGSGNVAQFAAEKARMLGAKVVSLSDSSGSVYDPDGINEEKLAWIKELKNTRRGRMSEYAKEFNVKYLEGQTPFGLPCDIALPCATQNELNLKSAKELIKNGCKLVSEGANMPTTLDALEAFRDKNVLFAPGKASNAGGVAVSGMEMTQNSMRLSWNRTELDERLQEIMSRIHNQCVEYGTKKKKVDYVRGANIAGFKKVADTIMAYGVM